MSALQASAPPRINRLRGRRDGDAPNWFQEGILLDDMMEVLGPYSPGTHDLVLDLLASIVTGTRFLDVLMPQATVFYAALKSDPDGDRQRLERLIGLPLPPNLITVRHLPRLKRGLIAHLEQVLAERPDIKVIVIDDLERISHVEDGYVEVSDVRDYLRSLAFRYKVSIVAERLFCPPMKYIGVHAGMMILVLPSRRGTYCLWSDIARDPLPTEIVFDSSGHACPVPLRASDALVAWSHDSGDIKVGHWDDRGVWARPYPQRALTSRKAMQSKSVDERRYALLSLFHALVQQQRLPVDTVHRELMRIEEFAQGVGSLILVPTLEPERKSGSPGKGVR